MRNIAQEKYSNHEIGASLYAKVRASFITQGTTLSAWCEKNEVWPASVRSALLGHWSGNKATVLINKVLAAAKIETSNE